MNWTYQKCRFIHTLVQTLMNSLKQLKKLKTASNTTHYIHTPVYTTYLSWFGGGEKWKLSTDFLTTVEQLFKDLVYLFNLSAKHTNDWWPKAEMNVMRRLGWHKRRMRGVGRETTATEMRKNMNKQAMQSAIRQIQGLGFLSLCWVVES